MFLFIIGLLNILKMISNFTDNLKINGGSEVQLDEMEYHRRISHKKKELVKIGLLILLMLKLVIWFLLNTLSQEGKMS